MRKDAFVLVSENELVFSVESLPIKKVSFKSDDYKDFDEYVSAVICDLVKKSDNELNSVNLVLDSEYYNCGEQITTHVRSKSDEKFKIRNFSNPITKEIDCESTSYFESHTEFLCADKSYERLDEVPLLQKYLKCKYFLSWNRERLASLKSKLAEYEIEISSYVPVSHFCNAISNSYLTRNAIIAMYEKHTEISVFDCGRLVRSVKLNFGKIDLVEHLSDVFNLSHKNSRLLLELYGFVSVPSKYVHCEIELPVFEKIKKCVKLTDISYEISTILKKQFSVIYREIKNYSVENVVFRGLPVSDANLLFQMMTQYECNTMPNLTYDLFSTCFDELTKNSYSKIVASVEKPIEPEQQFEVVEEKPDNNAKKVKREKKIFQENSRPVWYNSLVIKMKESKDKFEGIINKVEGIMVE